MNVRMVPLTSASSLASARHRSHVEVDLLTLDGAVAGQAPRLSAVARQVWSVMSARWACRRDLPRRYPDDLGVPEDGQQAFGQSDEGTRGEGPFGTGDRGVVEVRHQRVHGDVVAESQHAASGPTPHYATLDCWGSS